MSKILISLLSLSFIGCSSTYVVPQPNNTFEKTIVWHTATSMDQVKELCQIKHASLRLSSHRPLGCFWVNNNKCHVVSIDSMFHLRTLGHEVKHCFHGLWHDEQGKPLPGAFLVNP